jgi:hypothetical protein
VWDALHLYIANNLDWMEHWIKDCEEFFGRLSWEGVSNMIKIPHRLRHQIPDLTSQREVDLAYGLKDKKASKLFTHIFSSYFDPFFQLHFVCLSFQLYLLTPI